MRRGALACGVVALVAFLGGTGCATVIKGTRQPVSIFATPSDAKVTVYDSSGAVLTSQAPPVTLSLPRSKGYFSPGEYRVQVERAGYTPTVVTISGSINGWYIVGNFFIGGLIGWLIVDPLTGAMWDLHPTTVNANLAKQGAVVPREAAVCITLKPQASPERRE